MDNNEYEKDVIPYATIAFNKLRINNGTEHYLALFKHIFVKDDEQKEQKQKKEKEEQPKETNGAEDKACKKCNESIVSKMKKDESDDL